MTERRGGIGRRNNAPIRPPKPPSSFPDVLLALAAATLTTGILVFAMSFVDTRFTEDRTGQTLARLFGGALGVAGALLGGMVALLVSDNRRDPVPPLVVGLAVGGLETAVLAVIGPPHIWLLAAPPLLLILALRPVRAQMPWNTGQRAGQRRR